MELERVGDAFHSQPQLVERIDGDSRVRFFGDDAPFHSKGRGRSNMVSDFLVQHLSGPFFSLSPAEYQKALVQYPQLASKQYRNIFSPRDETETVLFSVSLAESDIKYIFGRF